MRRLPSFVIAFAIVFMAALLGTADRAPQAGTRPGADNALRIGLSLQPSNALVMIALDHGYFADQGLDVSVEKYVSGTRALRDGILAGKVDLVAASDVPVVLNSFDRQDFSVVATVFQTANQNRIVARADRGIAQPADLKGKRIATERGSAVHFFLHLFLLENGISARAADVSFITAEDLPKALARGDIDAFSMPEPFIGQARTLLGDNVIVFAAPGLYVQTEHLVFAKSFLNGKPDIAKKVLRVLVKAEEFAAGNARASQAIVARHLGASAAAAAATWPELPPHVSLEQSLLPLMENIGHWAVRRRLVENRQIPNFLNIMHFEALEAVRPAALTVVR